MAYELRGAGRSPVRFETEPEAMAAAKSAVAEEPDLEMEVIDLSTGKAAAPGSDKASREALKGSLGY